MDVIRSCYVGRMRFNEDSPPVSVRWFFADPKAIVFEASTPFRSSDFEPTPYQNNGIGPQYPPRGKWLNGQRPGRASGRVSCSQFTPSLWELGIPDNVMIEVPRLSNGVPVCCAPNLLGLAFSGSAKVRGGRQIGPPRGLLFGGSAKLPALYLKTILTNPTPGMTATGTITLQPWTVRIRVTLQGPGGGGGGTQGGSSASAGAGGGASGAEFTQDWPGITPGTTYNWQIGGGGVGGGPGNHPGQPGTAPTEFDGPTLITAAEGGGGAGCPSVPYTTGSVAVAGGAPGTAGNPGMIGGVMPGVSGNTPIGGAGACSPIGGAGNWRLTQGDGDDATGSTGSGGGGAVSLVNDHSGGKGSDGLIVVEEWNF